MERIDSEKLKRLDEKFKYINESNIPGDPFWGLAQADILSSHPSLRQLAEIGLAAVQVDIERLDEESSQYRRLVAAADRDALIAAYLKQALASGEETR